MARHVAFTIFDDTHDIILAYVYHLHLSKAGTPEAGIPLSPAP